LNREAGGTDDDTPNTVRHQNIATTSESTAISRKRNEYIETNSTCWVRWKCLGHGDPQDCEFCYHSEGYERRRAR